MKFTIADGRTSLYQYDTDVLLKLELETNESCDRVHFTSSSSSAYVASPYESNGNTYVRMADEALQKGANVTVFAWTKNSYADSSMTTEDSGRTFVKQVFKVIPRSKPDTYIYTPSGKMDWEKWSKEARLQADESQAWATGGYYETVDGEEVFVDGTVQKNNNAKYYSQQASAYAVSAEGFRDDTEVLKGQVVTLKSNIADFVDASEDEIEALATTKKAEITSHTNTKKAEITSHTNTKKAEIDSQVATAEASIASSVSQAETYASNASASADSASASATTSGSHATTAQGYASNASSSATSAQNSASSASGYASNASTYASNASTSAGQAQTYASNASASATSAQTYANNASSAVSGFDSRVATKTSEAVATVQAVVDTIPEDYTELTEEVADIKNDLIDKQDKLIAGANITIGEDGKTISATGGSGGGGSYDDTAIKSRLTLVETNKADKTEIPDISTKADVNHTHTQYLTEHQDISGKVDKIAGKGLSTNDYDVTAKAKVDAIPSNPKYTDTVVTDEHINSLIDAKLGVIENGTY